MSLAVIALCNAGTEIEPRHIDTLIDRQKQDGSYANGMGKLILWYLFSLFVFVVCVLIIGLAFTNR